jgi:hypothetical protein
VTCRNGILLGSQTDAVVNAMPNRQPQRSSILLGLPRAPKALLLQHTGVGKLNMVATRRFLRTFGSALMTLSAVWRTPNAHGYSIDLRYLMSGLF